MTRAITAMIEPLSCAFLKKELPKREKEVNARPDRIWYQIGIPRDVLGKTTTLIMMPTEIHEGTRRDDIVSGGS